MRETAVEMIVKWLLWDRLFKKKCPPMAGESGPLLKKFGRVG